MATRTNVAGRTNRSYGGGHGNFVSAVLNVDPPEFGPALKLIEIELLVAGSVLVSRDTLERDLPNGMWMHFAKPDTFPPLEARQQIRFERKRQTLQVAWPSRRLTPDGEFLASLATLTREHYFSAFDEVIDALNWALPLRLKAHDDFDVAGFLAWLRAKRDLAYESDAQLRDAVDAAFATRSQYFENLDPWEKLDVDWTRMHPEARKVLDQPEDWSCIDVFSPHGNDIGADIFADWPRFSRYAVAQAGHHLDLPPLAPDLPDILWSDWVYVHLALAFGHLKRSGTCPATIARETREIIAEERERAAQNHDWPHRDAWFARLERYSRILQRY